MRCSRARETWTVGTSVFHVKPAPLGRAPAYGELHASCGSSPHPAVCRWITHPEPPRREQSPPSREHPFDVEDMASTLSTPDRRGRPGSRRLGTIRTSRHLQDLRPRIGVRGAASAAPLISSAAELPFMASRTPADATSGIPQPTVGPSPPARGRSPRRNARSRAAPRPDSAPPAHSSSPSSSITSSRKMVRRCSGSTSVTVRSGRARASTSREGPRPSRGRRPWTRGQQLSDGHAVEDVPVPQSCLPRSDQAALDARLCDKSTYRSPSGSRSEENSPPRRFWRGGRFT